MKRRGADRVVGIDSDDRYLSQARYAAEVLDVEIDFRNMSVYEVASLGERFDVVIIYWACVTHACATLLLARRTFYDMKKKNVGKGYIDLSV
jgi:hypothetical protein